MEDTGRPSKRLHMETNESVPTETVQGDPWMPDGSIVLRVVSRTDQQVTHTLWKVHKSVLSYHSPFFCELFEGPGGSTLIDKASEQYGDVPLMDMQDDAKDMGDFLKALYSPGICF